MDPAVAFYILTGLLCCGMVYHEEESYKKVEWLAGAAILVSAAQLLPWLKDNWFGAVASPLSLTVAAGIGAIFVRQNLLFLLAFAVIWILLDFAWWGALVAFVGATMITGLTMGLLRATRTKSD